MLASLAILSPSTAAFPAPPANPAVQLSRQCQKVYTRSEAHRALRRIYRSPTPVSRFEAKVARRVVRCQATDRGRRIMRHHLARYRRHQPHPPGGNRGIAWLMLWHKGQLGQWPCLDPLWTHESGWDHTARNPSSGAQGIPQANGHGDIGSDPATQIRWGLGYIAGRYGSPCNAWAFWKVHGWY